MGKNEEETLRRDYDTLYGHLIGLNTDTAGKAVLIRCLDRLYESALRAADSASPTTT